jgi:hypothetical protein
MRGGFFVSGAKTFEIFSEKQASSSPLIDWSERFSQLKSDG